jgi:hypothetical protein
MPDSNSKSTGGHFGFGDGVRRIFFRGFGFGFGFGLGLAETVGSADTAGLAVVGEVAFTVALEVGLTIGFFVTVGATDTFGLVVAFGEAFTLTLAVGVGVGFLVAASALLAEEDRQSATTKAMPFSRAPI